MRTRILGALIAITVIFAVTPAPSPAQVFFDAGVSVVVPPPPIPFYYQPPVPGPSYIWEPGYWAWGPYGYFWVPGTWVLAPEVGLLWTPGYWYWSLGYYYWYPGYWATEVGFYGGVNYGCGYYGNGYVGGAWYGHVFRYNRYVSNVGDPPRVRNVYFNRSVYVNNTRSYRVGYNGAGGINARPTQAQLAVGRARHFSMTAVQRQHVLIAYQDRGLRQSVNSGHPTISTVARPFTALKGSTQLTRPALSSVYHPAVHSVYHPVTAVHSTMYHPATAVHQVYHPVTAVHQVYHPVTAVHQVYHPVTAVRPVYHPATTVHQVYHPAAAYQVYHSAAAVRPVYHAAPVRPAYIPQSRAPQHQPAPAPRGSPRS